MMKQFHLWVYIQKNWKHLEEIIYIPMSRTALLTVTKSWGEQILISRWMHKCGLYIQFSRLVVSDSLWPHGLQHARLLCSSPTPGAYSNSCPLSLWCHPTISSSIIPFSCLQSLTASGSFQMSEFFASDGQNIGCSASASVLPMNIQDWFPLGWTSWISLQSKGLSRVLQHHSSKASILFVLSFLYSPTLTPIHDY